MPNSFKHIIDITPIYSKIVLNNFQENDFSRECLFILEISSTAYKSIDRDSLFNLKPQLRGSLFKGEFQPDYSIKITATLQPDLLPELAEFKTGEEVTSHLRSLVETQLDHPLLDTENWYALQVKQELDDGETGYRTLWDYVNPVAIAHNQLSNSEITDRLVQFFRDQMQANPTDFSSEALENSLDVITKSFDQWLETNLVEGDRTLTDAIDAATAALDELIDSVAEVTDEFSTDQSIYDAMIRFFSDDDWSFTKLQGEPLLRLGFEGENGSWTCYAKAREAEQQFVFYSLCPIEVPEPQRSAIALFLTRANYGLLIGNFELDLTDGEIRYKTSIDVEGDRLTPALIKSLVYTNVLTMDQYLPGIQAVLEGSSPDDAIRVIEESTPSRPMNSDE